MNDNTPLDELPMDDNDMDDGQMDMQQQQMMQEQMMQQQMMQQQQQQQQQMTQKPDKKVSSLGSWADPKFLFSEFKSSILFAGLFFVFAYLFRVSSLKEYVPQLFDSNGSAGVVAKGAHAVLGGVVFYIINRFTPKHIQ